MDLYFAKVSKLIRPTHIEPLHSIKNSDPTFKIYREMSQAS